MSQNNNDIFGIDAYQALWGETIASVASQLIGADLKAETGSLNENTFKAGHWLNFTVSGALSGQQAIWIPGTDALQLAQSFMAEPLNPAVEFSDLHQDALAELIRQFAGTMAMRLKEILGADCSLRFNDAKAPSQPQAGKAAVLLVSTEPAVTLVSWIDQALLESLEKPAPKPAAPQPTIVVAESTAAPLNLTDRNLDLFLDLELDVSIRFGQRQMALKDVLELNAGAVVELDRRTRDPIELILGGRVIARGEAVVIDGNYGIRISEVVSPSQRLAQLA